MANPTDNPYLAAILKKRTSLSRIRHRRGVNTALLTEAAARRAVSVGAPFINVMSFNSAAKPGTAVDVSSWIVNPTATTYSYWVFATLYFGVPGFEPRPALAVQSRDSRWPHFSSAPFTLRAGEPGLIIRHCYRVPNLDPGTYHGSVILWREGYDVPEGQYFSRGFFYIEVLA